MTYYWKFQVHDIQNARDVGFIPGPCQHNRKFACVFVPCAIPLFYIGGESYVFSSVIVTQDEIAVLKLCASFD